MSIDSSFGTPEEFETSSRKSPETLEQEIDEQRSSIGHLVDELEKKISPGQLIDQALAYAKDNGGEFFGNLGSTLKANPVPVVLTSVGVLWLMMGSRTPSAAPSILDHAGERASDMADHVSDSLSSAKHRIQETTARMKDKASHLAENIGDKLSSPIHGPGRALQEKRLTIQSSAHTMLNEQPLVVAAMGVALGALIGAALPTSEREKRLIGQARDKLVEMAPNQTDHSPAGTGSDDPINEQAPVAEKSANPAPRAGPSSTVSSGLS